uniref:Uncharacterized protein n=1 Tax=Romanomermis culicivorax TaxID=13658 RepID=A0A915J3F7_ROMCU
MATYDWSLLHRGLVIMTGYGLCGAAVNADGQFQFSLRGMARERLIESSGLVVGQVAVCGGGRYLAIDVEFGVT